MPGTHSMGDTLYPSESKKRTEWRKKTERMAMILSQPASHLCSWTSLRSDCMRRCVDELKRRQDRVQLTSRRRQNHGLSEDPRFQ